MIQIKLKKLAATIALVAPVVALSAETALAATNYVAIAYSRSTGSTGYGKNYATRTAASRAALRQCRRYSGTTDCRVVITGRNTCVALASASNRASGWARNTYWKAQVNALVQCSKNGRYCKIRHAICAGR
ncbi:MAG: DUF4189 domain-containing protein [Calothrix sp. MO_167.B42]|nr:DUF4189 domain-containing protein [Calothrix sp. MO_167.B42]